MKIGFFDSGVGGMTVMYQAMQTMPEASFIFYADTKNVPYGDKPKEKVRGYIFEAIDYLANQNVDAVVVACNTATSIAIDDLRNRYDFPVLGIEPAVKVAVDEVKESHKKVLVMATTLTLNETKYKKLIERVNYNGGVDGVAMPGLVKLAEANNFDKEDIFEYLGQALKSYDVKEYGAVVLGCTHFPYFKAEIQEYFGKDVKVVSGSKGTAKNLKRIMNSEEIAPEKLEEIISTIEFVRSGEPVRDEKTLLRFKGLLHRIGSL